MLIKNGKIIKLYKENYVEDNIDLKNDVRNMINLKNQIVVPAFTVKKIYMLPLLLFKYNKYLKFNTLGEAEIYFSHLNTDMKKLILEDFNKYILNKGIGTILLKEDNSKDSINNKVNDYLIKNSSIMYLKEMTSYKTINNDIDINAKENFGLLDPLKQVKSDIKKDMMPYLALKKELYTGAKEANHSSEFGLLKEGYYANFMILNKNIFNLEKGQEDELEIIQTYSFANKVEEKNNSGPFDTIKNSV